MIKFIAGIDIKNTAIIAAYTFGGADFLKPRKRKGSSPENFAVSHAGRQKATTHWATEVMIISPQSVSNVRLFSQTDRPDTTSMPIKNDPKSTQSLRTVLLLSIKL
ncbi:MAG: hypothetical protein K1W02_00805 [Muribaculaceae bacterium]